jgi:hypothetical protein
MKRIVITLLVAAQPSIVALVGGYDFAAGGDLAMLYVITVAVGVFAWSYPA